MVGNHALGESPAALFFSMPLYRPPFSVTVPDRYSIGPQGGAVHSSQQAEAARQAMTHYEPVSKRTTNPIGMMTKLRRNTTKTPRSCPHMLLSESALAAVSISSLDAPHRAAQPLMRFSVHQNGQRSENDNPNSG